MFWMLKVQSLFVDDLHEKNCVYCDRRDHNTVELLIHIPSYCIDCCECNLFYIPCSEFLRDKDVTKTFLARM